MHTPRNNPISILQLQQEPRPFLPFPRSRSSAIHSLSTQQQENTQNAQNAGEGEKKTEKTITNANAKTINQKITKIKTKTVKNPSQKKNKKTTTTTKPS
jgi:hypothetical protein